MEPLKILLTVLELWSWGVCVCVHIFEKGNASVSGCISEFMGVHCLCSERCERALWYAWMDSSCVDCVYSVIPQYVC